MVNLVCYIGLDKKLVKQKFICSEGYKVESFESCASVHRCFSPRQGDIVWINSILATLTVTWQQESSYWLNFTTNCFVVVVLTFIYCISHLSGWWVENHVSSGDVKTLVLLSCQSVSSVYGHQSYSDTTSFFFSVMTHL